MEGTKNTKDCVADMRSEMESKEWKDLEAATDRVFATHRKVVPLVEKGKATADETQRIVCQKWQAYKAMKDSNPLAAMKALVGAANALESGQPKILAIQSKIEKILSNDKGIDEKFERAAERLRNVAAESHKKSKKTAKSSIADIDHKLTVVSGSAVFKLVQDLDEDALRAAVEEMASVELLVEKRSNGEVLSELEELVLDCDETHPSARKSVQSVLELAVCLKQVGKEKEDLPKLLAVGHDEAAKEIGDLAKKFELAAEKSKSTREMLMDVEGSGKEMGNVRYDVAYAMHLMTTPRQEHLWGRGAKDSISDDPARQMIAEMTKGLDKALYTGGDDEDTAAGPYWDA